MKELKPHLNVQLRGESRMYRSSELLSSEAGDRHMCKCSERSDRNEASNRVSQNPRPFRSCSFGRLWGWGSLANIPTIHRCSALTLYRYGQFEDIEVHPLVSAINDQLSAYIYRNCRCGGCASLTGIIMVETYNKCGVFNGGIVAGDRT